MSVRRTRPLAEQARAAALELSRSEAEIALLDRVRPLNWLAEQTRLTRALEAGRAPDPAFEYAPPPRLAELRRRLSAAHDVLAAGDAEERLLAQRALELELEASLAEHVGGPDFARLAARRFPAAGAESVTARSAREFVVTAPESIPSGISRLSRL